MLQIRNPQMNALAQAAAKDFEERMVAHVGQHFRAQCEALGPAATREAIRYGVARAASHEITIERDVAAYIDVMFAFGRDFDRDPSLPWAAAILGDRAELATARARRLLDESMNHLDRAVGITPARTRVA